MKPQRSPDFSFGLDPSLAMHGHKECYEKGSNGHLGRLMLDGSLASKPRMHGGGDWTSLSEK